MSDAAVHPILPTAQAVKAAMDDILAKARLALDVSPYLDEKGRLPFANLLPLLQALPDSEPATKANLLKAMSYIDGEPMGDLISEAITAIADDARIVCNGIVSLPNCTAIGAHAFANYIPADDAHGAPFSVPLRWRDGYGNLFASRNVGYPTLKGDEASFAKVEALGEWALAGAIAANYVSFPLVKTVPARAFCGCSGDVTLPAVTAIAADAFAPLVVDGHPYSYRRVTTLRLPYITEENVKAMPGYPFGMETYMFWHVKSTTRIICRGNTVIVPSETKVIQ